LRRKGWLALPTMTGSSSNSPSWTISRLRKIHSLRAGTHAARLGDLANGIGANRIA
jgi:hypothetical protein